MYILSVGRTTQPIYLTNNAVKVSGFYDGKNPTNSSLSFDGIDDYMELSRWIPTEKVAKKKTIDPNVKGKLHGNMYSALAYIAKMCIRDRQIFDELAKGSSLSRSYDEYKNIHREQVWSVIEQQIAPRLSLIHILSSLAAKKIFILPSGWQNVA